MVLTPFTLWTLTLLRTMVALTTLTRNGDFQRDGKRGKKRWSKIHIVSHH